MNLCACGCGKEIAFKKSHKYYHPKFIRGHNRKGVPRLEETKKKISVNRLKRKEKLGYLNSIETRIKISLANKGRKVIHSEETKEKIRQKALEQFKNGVPRETIIKRMNTLKNRGIDLKGKNNPFYNKHHSEESKKKLSLSHLGKKPSENAFTKEAIKKRVETRRNNNYKPSEETKKKISLSKIKNPTKYWLGKHLSKETKEKLRLAMLGEKSSLWQGGISFEPYGLEFNKELKEQIRKRDNFRCQECMKHQDELIMKCKDGRLRRYKLHIHHIDYNKKNNNPNNLISLCATCHIQTNYGRNDWTNYFQQKMLCG